MNMQLELSPEEIETICKSLLHFSASQIVKDSIIKKISPKKQDVVVNEQLHWKYENQLEVFPYNLTELTTKIIDLNNTITILKSNMVQLQNQLFNPKYTPYVAPYVDPFKPWDAPPYVITCSSNYSDSHTTVMYDKMVIK